MSRFNSIGLMLVFLLFSRMAVADAHEQFNRAMDLSNQGQWQLAAEIFQQLAKQQPEWPEPKNNLAVVLLNLGKVEQARQTLEQAVTSQPSFKVAQANRQKLYDHLAAQAYEKALGNTPKQELPHLQLLEQIQVAAQLTESPSAADSTSGAVAKIRQQLKLWTSAWAASDVDGYFACYSSNYRHFEQNIDFQQWRNQRRLRLKSAKGVEVDLDNIRVFVEPQGKTALVEFTQTYRSQNYSDKVIKQLLLGNESQQWLITSERVIKLL